MLSQGESKPFQADANARPCKQSKYQPSYWKQSKRQIQDTERFEPKTNWYNNQTTDGTYLPNEEEKTCGETVKFGQIVCPKGQDCDSKQGAYPFIAVLGI